MPPVVHALKPESSGNVRITDDTIVLCCHRGRRDLDERGFPIPLNPRDPPKGYAEGNFGAPGYRGDLQDTFDSAHYTIPVGYFTAPHAAAQHFKRRAVVPGSRNPETNFQASFIAILGVPGPFSYNLDGSPRIYDEAGKPTLIALVDPEEDWEPFTDDECRAYGHALEALDRQSMVDPIDGQVEIKTVAGVGNRGVIPAAPSRVKGGGQASGSRRKPQIGGTGVDALQRKNAPGRNEAIDDIARTRAERVSPGDMVFDAEVPGN